MNRKLLTIILVAVFLITSLGVISAAKDSDSISVKIVWDDNVDDKPDFIKVNLLKDGKIVDSANLNESNSWKVDFSVDDDGKYQVKEEISSDYSAKIKGNAQEGFVITNKLVKTDVLGAGDNQTPLEESSNASQLSANNESGLIEASNDSAKQNNASSGNGTQNSTDTNSTNSTNSTVPEEDDDDDTDDDSSDESTSTVTTTKITKTVVKKAPKEAEKKPVNTTEKMKKTGFPLIVLVIAAFVAIFVPISRKK